MPNVNFKASHTTLTDGMASYVNKKLEALQKFLHPENNIHVELSADPKHKSGLRYRAEITIFPKPGLYAEARGNDLYEAIDLCLPKIKTQLAKKKDKKVKEKKRVTKIR